MAKSESITVVAPAAVLCADRVEEAVAAAWESYDLMLELQSLLDAFTDLEPAPKWAFALERMAHRARDQADSVHTLVRRLLPEVAP